MAALKFQVGDRVRVTGPIYQSANGTLTKGSLDKQIAVISKIASKGAHPYAVEGIFGWFNEAQITKIPQIAVKVGDTVKVLKPITYHGQRIVLKYNDYVVTDLVEDKATITHNHVQTVVVNATNLEKIK